MGMRFKKSKKIAPGVKLNVSNKSVGVSVGGKGVHHSVSSSGRKTTTVSAPGTGLSYVKTSGGGSRKRKSSKKAQSGTVGCGTILLGFILFFFIIGVFSSGLSSGRKKAAESAVSSSSATPTVSVMSETSTPTPTEAPAETKVMYSKSSLNIRAAASADAEKLGTFSAGDSVTVISSENGWSKIDYNGTEAYVASDYLSDTQPTAAPAATQAPSSSDQQETMVWVSDSGKKYHSKSSCSNMSNPHQISLSDAQAQGYTPCKKCH